MSNLNTTDEEAYKRWQQQLKEIEKEMYDANSILEALREYIGIVNKNTSIQNPDFFHRTIYRTWVTYIALSIRRLVDKDARTRSFRRLLGDIAENNKILTLERFSSNYPSPVLADDVGTLRDSRIWAKGDFCQFDRESKGFFSKGVATEDIMKIENLACKIKEYIDKSVAHADLDIKPRDVSLVNIEEFYKEFADIFKRYYLLLTGKYLDSITPYKQYDWMEIFKHPFILSK